MVDSDNNTEITGTCAFVADKHAGFRTSDDRCSSAAEDKAFNWLCDVGIHADQRSIPAVREADQLVPRTSNRDIGADVVWINP